jgi:putative ABC transport system permease protein
VGWLGVGAMAEIFPKFPVEAPRWAQAAGIATALLSGTVFGVLPARRASRLEPVAALARR